MFGIRTLAVLAANIFLMGLSWVYYKYPQGDEYLVLYMIAILFMSAPYVMPVKAAGIMLGVNFIFLLFYFYLGALNPVDVSMFVFLFASAAGAHYMVKALYSSFDRHHRTRIRSEEQRYDVIVDQLDVVDRKGRKVESELNRTTRLYEVTKRLAPVLKSEELLDALFDFLEENFRFDNAHLLKFTKGVFSRGISRGVTASGERGRGASKDKLDYEGIVALCENRKKESIYIGRGEDDKSLKELNVKGETLMVTPLYVGDMISAILVIEGISRANYTRFRILIPQIALELRKVELYERVQELAIIDGLTEVYLRRYLMDRLEEEVDRAQRLGLTFSVGMVDVDHFKECNDRYGHLVGDVVLKKIAEKLKNSVREVDLISRYGGEEFCIVLPETTKELALVVAERLRASVADNKIRAFDEDVKATVSVGVSTYPGDADTVEGLIEKADTALYRAKRKGRNRVSAVS